MLDGPELSFTAMSDQTSNESNRSSGARLNSSRLALVKFTMMFSSLQEKRVGVTFT